MAAGALAGLCSTVGGVSIAAAQTMPGTTLITSAGATTGLVTVTSGGIPGLLSLCAPTLWTYQSLGTLVLQVNLNGTFYPPDFVTMTMSVSGCENANGGGGTVAGGSIAGAGILDPNGLSCSLSGGAYSRQLVLFTASVPASCSIHGVAATPTTLQITGAWAPISTDGEGVVGTIQHAQMTGVIGSAPG